MKQTKSEAVREIIWEAQSERSSNASVKRLLRALKTLDLDDKDRIMVLSYLHIANRDTGEPFSKLIKRIW